MKNKSYFKSQFWHSQMPNCKQQSNQLNSAYFIDMRATMQCPSVEVISSFNYESYETVVHHNIAPLFQFNDLMTLF